MKLPKLPRWLSPAPAPTPDAPAASPAEVVQQLEQRLSDADAEIAQLETRTQESLSTFAQNRTSENLELHESCEIDLARLRKLRALVVSDLDAAKTVAAVAERQRLEALISELREQEADRSKLDALYENEVQCQWASVNARLATHEELRRLAHLRVRILELSPDSWFPADLELSLGRIANGLLATLPSATSELHGALIQRFAKAIRESGSPNRIMPSAGLPSPAPSPSLPSSKSIQRTDGKYY